MSKLSLSLTILRQTLSFAVSGGSGPIAGQVWTSRRKAALGSSIVPCERRYHAQAQAPPKWAPFDWNWILYEWIVLVVDLVEEI